MTHVSRQVVGSIFLAVGLVCLPQIGAAAESAKFEMHSAPPQLKALGLTITVTLINASKIDVAKCEVGLQDSQTGDSRSVYFGRIPAGRSSSGSTDLAGGADVIVAKCDGSDGSGWFGTWGAKDATNIEITLKDSKS